MSVRKCSSLWRIYAWEGYSFVHGNAVSIGYILRCILKTVIIKGAIRYYLCYMHLVALWRKWIFMSFETGKKPNIGSQLFAFGLYLFLLLCLMGEGAKEEMGEGVGCAFVMKWRPSVLAVNLLVAGDLFKLHSSFYLIIIAIYQEMNNQFEENLH